VAAAAGLCAVPGFTGVRPAYHPHSMARKPPKHRALLGCLLAASLSTGTSAVAATIYKWMDAEGTLHLSSEKPPPGVQYEKLSVASTPSQPGSRSQAAARSAPSGASPARAASRSEVLANLRVRECVIALEALERLTSGAEPTSAAELNRLQQTVSRNCSSDPARRREEEEMAARLRIANGPDCAEARQRLARMMQPGADVEREQLRSQQQFVSESCTAPVR
jgi:hypothetical protein